MFIFFIIAGFWIGGINAGCDLTAIQACDKNRASVATLISWAAINKTTLEGFTFEFVNSSCGIWLSYLECTKTVATDTCANDPKAATFNKIRELVGLYCNQEFLCLYNSSVCALEDLGLIEELLQWGQGKINAPTSKCSNAMRMNSCLNAVSPACRFSVEKNTTDLSAGINFLTQLCDSNNEKDCSALNACKDTYNNGVPVGSPFNATICTRWKDYVNCSGGALSSCPGVGPINGTPSTAEIATSANEYCTMLSDVSLYSCDAFQDCVTYFIGATQVDIFSPKSFCLVAQIMTGCAAYSASNATCKVTNATSFIERANKLALKATGMGCGNPYLHIDNCLSLVECNSALSAVVDNSSSNFVQKCSAINTYQSCASNATVSCGLTIPANAREPGPRLDTLSGISKRVCDALNGQSVSTCPKFLACIGNGDQIPMESGERPVGRAWCPIMRRVMECVLFYEDQCTISAALKNTVGTEYKNLITAGCPDVYQYQTRPATATFAAAAPTGESLCLINSTLCAVQELKLTLAFMEWEKTGVAPNTSYCSDTTRMNSCLATSSSLCRISEKQTADMARGTDIFTLQCKEDNCSALSNCKKTYSNVLKANTSFNATTCSAWQDYVNCSGGAVSSCPGITPTSGTPSTAEIVALSKEYCTMLTESALYSCMEFQGCVNTFLNGIIKVDILSPNSFCLVAQIMTGCAAYSASNAACKVTNATSFIERSNKLALKATGMGCGNPYLHINNCPSLVECNKALSVVTDNSQSNFVQKCSALYAYQSCASNATVSCGLTIPANAREPGPRLDTLSVISKRVCDAMTGQNVLTCPKFLECMANGDQIPSEQGERPVGRAWCPIMRRVLECVLFYEDQCPISAALKTTVGTEYKNLITAGCPDVYQYQARTAASTVTTNAPTAGANSNRAFAATVYLLLMSSAFTLFHG